MSLMTAIKLLQVDVNVQGETTGSWTEIRSNKKAESKHPTDSPNASRSSVITVDDSFDDKPKGPSVRVNTNRFSLLSVEGTDTSANEERNSNVNVITPNTSDDRPRKNDQRQKSRGDGFQDITSAERSRKNDQRQMSRGHGFQENTSDDRPRKNEQRQKDRKTVIIAGDSMIQHVHSWEMSNTEVSVAVKSFSGAKIDDMNDFLQPIIRRSPDEIILHIGTNNIKGNDSPEVLAAGISRLASMITKKSPNTKVTISGLIVRKGLNLKSKIKSVNKLLKSTCMANNWPFLDNSNLDESCLNLKGLHLNRKGTSYLSSNFSNYI